MLVFVDYAYLIRMRENMRESRWFVGKTTHVKRILGAPLFNTVDLHRFVTLMRLR